MALALVTQVGYDHRDRLEDHYNLLSAWMESVDWYRDERVETLIESRIPVHARRVLELGCGNGRLIHRLASRHKDKRFVAVDISGEMVRRAREKVDKLANVEILHGDWIQPLFGSSMRFDAIIVKNALHLIPDLEERLRELSVLSKTLVIVETVSPNLDSNEFVRKVFSIIDGNKIKQALFTKRSLMSSLKKSGWACLWEVRVEQYIDVEEWLRHKAETATAHERATEYLRSVGTSSRKTDSRVRRSMRFNNYRDGVPGKMLRLQFIGQFERREARRPSRTAQLRQASLDF